MELLVDPDFTSEGRLCAEESLHCVKVMRHREGDHVVVTDGRGTRFDCTLAKADARGCELTVETETEMPEPTHELRMAVAPTKNIDRFEWFVEKAVEIGVSRITPIETEHSERTRVRVDRLQRIVVAAAKQSLKYRLPVVDDVTPIADILKADVAEQRFILHCGENPKEHLFNAAKAGVSTIVLIGPEGDFSAREVETALSNGFQECTLGPERLRTETAAMVATNIVALRNQI